MSQESSLTAAFKAQNVVKAKALDYAFVIAGSDTIYTVAKDSYALTGSPFSQFNAIRSWGRLPAAIGEAAKGRPEDGSFSLGEMRIDVLDRVSSGSRALSSLVSREAELRGPAGSSGTATKLTAGIAADTTSSMTVASGASLPATNGVVYVGLECIKYATNSGGAPATLSTLTRGYRLTSPTFHGLDYVYSFMPSLHRRKAYLYKGYQNLGLADWAPAWGGVIAGVEKVGPSVRFRVMSTTWHTYNDSERVIFLVSKGFNGSMGQISLAADLVSGEYASIPVDLTDSPPAASLVNSYLTFLLDVGGELTAITAAS